MGMYGQMMLSMLGSAEPQQQKVVAELIVRGTDMPYSRKNGDKLEVRDIIELKGQRQLVNSTLRRWSRLRPQKRLAST